MKKIKILYFKAMNLSLILLFCGCVSFQNQDIILEKSNKDTPLWTYSEDKNFNTNENIFLVYKKSDIYNLYLGLKQAQAAATLQTSYLIMQKIQTDLLNKLNEFTKKNSIKNESILSELSQKIKENRLTIRSQPANPKEIYWEYRQRDTDNGPERFYIVWVLLTIPKLDYESALLNTARNLIKSEQKDIVDLGQNILQQISPR
ncbi:hypothetical protein QEJ31_08710 [Pigmentibacter sp. JX0631]|uniref:hypothetical protein n=1 Tax=Pigmentibacter sp. JX0631 TaxID=2976982 RepID=UPI0024689CAC|nr:hypothetical protein [Pigmentibacter sp. JX0631]WGL58615.1 hypothetical protein QEJ31_08710 [Pigmentibacter sp. JX0631]